MALPRLLHGLYLLVVLLFKGCYSQVPSAAVCGWAPLNNKTDIKIVGGENAAPGSWPWQVSIHRKPVSGQWPGGHWCGGSFINHEWVLSAAHCFPRGVTKDSLTIFLGLNTQESPNPNEVNRTVIKIILHPEYNQMVQFNNDIALLKLSSPVTFTEYIRPVCLAAMNSTFSDGTMSWVTGWGDIHQDEPLPPPQILQEVDLPVVGNNKCRSSYHNLTDNMMCAGGGGKDACQRDSGGPMLNPMEFIFFIPTTRWVQSGIVSFGRGCAEPNFPGVYARVSRFQKWIKMHIPTDQPGFLIYPPPPPPPPPPVKPCESLFCGGLNTIHFSYFTYVLTLALMLYSMAGFV